MRKGGEGKGREGGEGWGGEGREGEGRGGEGGGQACRQAKVASKEAYEIES